jgi:hypothetical protein
VGTTVAPGPAITLIGAGLASLLLAAC